MPVQLETTIKRFRGLSTDEKPGRDAVPDFPKGSTFTETDTGRRFVWTGSWPWTRQDQTIETLLNALLSINEELLDVLRATHRGHEEHLWDEDVETENT